VPGEENPVQSSRKYRNQDGLLENEIFNFHINKTNGEIWIATSKGLNMSESSGRIPAVNVQSARVFPNPFKPDDDFVVFDNLVPSSELYIFSQSGNLIYKVSENQIYGGQFKWNATNQQGRPVKSGVYFYVVKSKKSSAKGKFVVSR
jgi:ligand-binding sensor domain-containing protein